MEQHPIQQQNGEEDGGGAAEVLIREMVREDGEGDDVVYKRERIRLKGEEVEVRRVFVLFGSYRVGWVHDADVSVCMACSSEFGFFNRKHHCRACGAVVCSTCSPYRAQVPNLNGTGREGQVQASRVCINCFGLKMSSTTQHTPKAMSDVIQKFIAKQTGQSLNNGGELLPEDQQSEGSKGTKKREKRAEFEDLQFQLMEEPKYSKAYRRMRGIIPPYIAAMTLQSLFDTGLPKAVAERIWSKRCLWLIVTHKEDIRKMHVADLRSKYTPIGLDLTERYAVWFNLPDWEREGDIGSDNTHKFDKIEWKSNFKTQMDEMARKHARNELKEDHVRHSVYVKYEPIHLFSHRAPIKQQYTNDLNSKNLVRDNPLRSLSRASSSNSSSRLSPFESFHSARASPCEGKECTGDYKSPVVPLFTSRTHSNSFVTGMETASKDCHGNYTCDASPVAACHGDSGSVGQTLESRRQKREERIQDRRRRTSRALQSSTSWRAHVPKDNLSVSSTESTQKKYSDDETTSSILSEEQRLELNKILAVPVEVLGGSNSDADLMPLAPLDASSHVNTLPDMNAISKHDSLTSAPSPRSQQLPQRLNSKKKTMTKVGETLLADLIDRGMPTLTVTPLREMMSDNTTSQRKSVIEVVQRINKSEIVLTAIEATELLKYAVVNLMDMREGEELGIRKDQSEPNEVEYESAMLAIVEFLVVKCKADVDTLDRNGNGLLTFLQDSITPEMRMSGRLIPTLLEHGINIINMNKESAQIEIHPLFVSLSKRSKLVLIDKLSTISSVELNRSQKFTYFTLLVVVGRVSLASLMLNSVREMLTPGVASAIMQICQFDTDSMEDPIETFELLDQLGAQC